MAQNDLERHENGLFCVCESPSARGMIFMNHLYLITPQLFMGLLFGRPVKNSQLCTGHRNIQKAPFCAVPNHFVPNNRKIDRKIFLHLF